MENFEPSLSKNLDSSFSSFIDEKYSGVDGVTNGKYKCIVDSCKMYKAAHTNLDPLGTAYTGVANYYVSSTHSVWYQPLSAPLLKNFYLHNRLVSQGSGITKYAPTLNYITIGVKRSTSGEFFTVEVPVNKINANGLNITENISSANIGDQIHLTQDNATSVAYSLKSTDQLYVLLKYKGFKENPLTAHYDIIFQIAPSIDDYLIIPAKYIVVHKNDVRKLTVITNGVNGFEIRLSGYRKFYSSVDAFNAEWQKL